MFERFLGDAGADPSDVVTSQWAPRVDIKEEADRFVIFADIRPRPTIPMSMQPPCVCTPAFARDRQPRPR